MGPITQEMKAHRSKVLAEVETHLKTYPMGEFYFGKLATKNPNVIRRLRDGGAVNETTLDQLRAFMKAREKKLSAGTP